MHYNPKYLEWGQVSYIYVIFHFFRQGTIGIKSEDEAPFLLQRICFNADFLLESFVLDYDIVFLGESAYLTHNVQRIVQIYDKDPVEHTDNEGEGDIIVKPYDKLYHIFLYEKIIDSRKQCPDHREPQAYDPADIKPFLGIVPKLDLHSFDKDQTCDKLDECHHGSHRKYLDDHLQNIQFAYHIIAYIGDQRHNV